MSMSKELSKPAVSMDEHIQLIGSHNEVVGKYNELLDKCKELTAERDSALAQVEQLKGIKPELPPFPSQFTLQGDDLPRYGIRWNSPTEPLTVPMDDGYWTPYHLALAQNAELVAMVEALRKSLSDVIRHSDLNTGNEPSLSLFQRTIDEASKVWRLTPTQHLRDRDAEIGRAGYFRGHMDAGGGESEWHKKHSERHADQYAEKARRGEV